MSPEWALFVWSSALSRPMVLKVSQSWAGSAKDVKLLRDG